jgi:phosphosulfolactate phosphohydrolase-like enzyme
VLAGVEHRSAPDDAAAAGHAAAYARSGGDGDGSGAAAASLVYVQLQDKEQEVRPTCSASNSQRGGSNALAAAGCTPHHCCFGA